MRIASTPSSPGLNWSVRAVLMQWYHRLSATINCVFAGDAHPSPGFFLRKRYTRMLKDVLEQVGMSHIL